MFLKNCTYGVCLGVAAPQSHLPMKWAALQKHDDLDLI